MASLEKSGGFAAAGAGWIGAALDDAGCGGACWDGGGQIVADCASMDIDGAKQRAARQAAKTAAREAGETDGERKGGAIVTCMDENTWHWNDNRVLTENGAVTTL